MDITCPNCGPRPVEEYRFGGEIPAVPDSVEGAEARELGLQQVGEAARHAGEELVARVQAS